MNPLYSSFCNISSEISRGTLLDYRFVDAKCYKLKNTEVMKDGTAGRPKHL